ncbi:MAG: hypothetical protein RSA84_26320, partial [Acinetobacter sp.]
SISFMAQGKFYTLKDNGTGRLVGASDSIGTGSINYQTGSWLLTTGALPDVGTPILLLWGTPIATFARANLPVLPAAIEFDLGQVAIAASSVTVSWLLEGVSKSATSNALGQFTGDATGSINYAAGVGKLIPNKLPQKNTVFSFEFNYGDPKNQTVSAVTPDLSQKLTFNIGTGSAIQPNSVELQIPVSSGAGSTVFQTVALFDVPLNSSTGNLVDRLGNVQGTITYASGAVEVTPVLNVTSWQKVYSAQTYYVSS